MSVDPISRRTLLEAAVRIAALPAGIEFFSAWTQASQISGHVHSSSAPPAPSFVERPPQFFSPSDFEALQAFTEILIPTDSTPGARQAHCAHFIDFLVHSMGDHYPETQQQWTAALAALKAAGFHGADAKGREALVRQIAEPERNPSVRHPAYFAYRLIKRENTFAFYTAHAGMIGALDYRGNSYNLVFPACTHPEHHEV